MDKTSIKVSFRIMGEDFDAGHVAKKLDIIPTETWKKGEKIRNTEQRRSYTAWIYKLDYIESLDMGYVAKKIQQIFRSKTNIISELKRMYNLDISIDFAIVIENEEVPAMCLDSSFIKFAAEIDARIDIDTYIN